MGVASQNFKINKKSFNRVGERQLLHISNLADYKKFDLTCISVDGLETLLHVASEAISGSPGIRAIEADGKKYLFNFVGEIDNNDLEFNNWVVENCDFYIHTGIMDAQATTILENCARGLIPLVTPESGFSSPHAIYLSQDADENRKIIDWALKLPESELLKRSELIRQQVSVENNWETIFNKIWNEITSDIDGRHQYQSSKITYNRLQKDIQYKSNMADERIFISRNQMLQLENQIRLERHIERYALLRQFAQGVVCDAACGCGYGSYLLATNPDVQRVIGLDIEADAISHAKKEYSSEKVEFETTNLSDWVSDKPIDMLISVETIEHIKDKAVLPGFVERNSIDQIILTYPSKKTSHYNRYHYYDFRLQDILDLFPAFTCYRHFNWEYEFDVVFLIRKPINKSKRLD